VEPERKEEETFGKDPSKRSFGLNYAPPPPAKETKGGLVDLITGQPTRKPMPRPFTPPRVREVGTMAKREGGTMNVLALQHVRIEYEDREGSPLPGIRGWGEVEGLRKPKTQSREGGGNPGLARPEGETSLKTSPKEEGTTKLVLETNTGGEARGMDCPICRDRYVTPHTARCGHVCCHSCWMKCLELKLECPVCREKVRGNQLRPVYL
jgi:hypothetical protein